MGRSSWLAGLAIAAPLSGGALAADYNYIRIVVPGSVATYPGGLNDAGLVVGHWMAADQSIHGYVRRQGAIQILDYPGAIATYPSAINNRGEIVGTWWDHVPHSHGFIYSKGQFRVVDDYAGIDDVSLRSINDAGEIVGLVKDIGGAAVFTFHKSRFNFVVWTNYPEAVGINAAGEVAGNYNNAPDPDEYTEAFAYENGAIVTPVNTRPGTFKSFIATGINAAGTIVGDLQTEPFSQGGFIWQSGVVRFGECSLGLGTSYLAAINDAGFVVGGFTGLINGIGPSVSVGTVESPTACLGTLNVPGATTLTTTGINNAGKVLGSYSEPNGPTETFLAVPVP